MNSLTFHELKKLLSRRSLIIAVAVLLCANIINIYRANDKYHDSYNLAYNLAEWRLYEDVEGKISEETINSLYAYKSLLGKISSGQAQEAGEYYGVNAYEDSVLVSGVITKLERAAGYKSEIETLLENNGRQAAVYEKKGNAYLMKTASLIEQTYSSRSIDCYYNVEGYGAYLSYDYSSFLILLIVFLATSSLYAQEREGGMLPLLRSAPLGRMRLSHAKQTAAALFSSGVCALFFLCDFLMFLWCARPRGIGQPLYSVEAFAYTPLTVSIWEFAVLSAALKFFGVICFALVSCFFSSVLGKSLDVLVADFAVCLFLMTLSALSGDAFSFANMINPVNLLICRTMFASFEVTNVLGEPVFKFYVSFACTAILALTASAATGLVNNKNIKTGRRAK